MKLGDFSKEEFDLAQKRIEEARQHGQVPEGAEVFEVAVAVWVNGHLQYHGGSTIGQSGGNDKVLPRALMKQVACAVLHDIDPNGNCTLAEEK